MGDQGDEDVVGFPEKEKVSVVSDGWRLKT